MRLCEPFPTNTSDWDSLYQNTLTMYSEASQFNYQSTIPTFNVSRPLDILINQTLVANSDGEVMRIPLQMNSLQPPDQCLNWNRSFSGEGTAGVQVSTWAVVQCVSLPADVSEIGEGLIFPPQTGIENQPGNCKKMGLPDDFTLLTNNEVIAKYKFTMKDLADVKRILFTQGGFDPTTSVGPPPFELSGDLDATRTILMYGNGHGEEVFPSFVESTDTVKLVSILYLVYYLPYELRLTVSINTDTNYDEANCHRMAKHDTGCFQWKK
jgi:hypothetical protein